MKNIGIIYGSSTGNTEFAAAKILEILGENNAEMQEVYGMNADRFMQYNKWILGISTWSMGSVQDDWAEFLDTIKDCDFTQKQAAIFGFGDQESYPETFVDGIYELFTFLKKRGCKIIGSWPTDGYNMAASKAIVDNQFIGLPLDYENQNDLTNNRLTSWVKQVIQEFK